MHHQLSDTAVLVFVRDEREEARLKSFRARLGLRANLRVVHTLNQHVTSVTRQAGLPTIFIKGHQQVGSTFGERFTNAIEAVFSAGYERVITIGNDCLSLNAGHLHTIAKALEQGTDMVLGPAQDGGVYAIGIRRQAFQKDRFLLLPWQTPDLFSALVNYIIKIGATYHHLPTAIDADDEQSFQKALKHLVPATRLGQILRNLVQVNCIQVVINISFRTQILFFITLLRAPPVLLHP
ncbi:MAG: DUF2064 domain-containing protein [Saprospiraceae bacterium]